MVFLQGANYEIYRTFTCSRRDNIYGHFGRKGRQVFIGLFRRVRQSSTDIIGRQHLILCSRTKRRLLVLAIASYIALC